MSGAAMYRAQYASLSPEQLLEEVCKLKDAVRAAAAVRSVPETHQPTRVLCTQLEQERKRSNGLADEVRMAREQTLTMVGPPASEVMPVDGPGTARMSSNCSKPFCWPHSKTSWSKRRSASLTS